MLSVVKGGLHFFVLSLLLASCASREIEGIDTDAVSDPEKVLYQPPQFEEATINVEDAEISSPERSISSITSFICNQQKTECTFNGTGLVIKQYQTMKIGTAKLVMQGDGNLVLSKDGITLWSSRSGGQNCGKNQCFALLQKNGNFVVYNKTKPLWQSGAAASANIRMVVSTTTPYIQIKTGDSVMWASSYVFKPGLVMKQNSYIRMGTYNLVMQGDGNLVFYNNNKVLMSTQTGGKKCVKDQCYAIFKPTGNFEVHTNKKLAWHSGTGGGTKARLILSATAPYAQIREGDNILWASSYSFKPPLVIKQNNYIRMGSYILVMQSDGNLVYYGGNKALISSETGGQNCGNNQCYAAFLPGGRLVIYNGKKEVRSFPSPGKSPVLRMLQTSPYVKLEDEASFNCYDLAAYNSNGRDSSAVLQKCINQTPRNQTLLLPAGVYTIEHEVLIKHPLTISTAGRLGQPPCTIEKYDNCAQLKASANTYTSGGFIKIESDNVKFDHIVVNGNRYERYQSAAASKCRAGDNTYGMNIRFSGNNISITNGGFVNALCGTGLYLIAGSNYYVAANTVGFNGIHNESNLWSDGLTAIEIKKSRIVSNLFIDNTDVDLIFGACESCIIQSNEVRHSNSFNSSSFAGIMIHSWPNGSSGNYNGADISRNVVNCSEGHRCGIGIYLGQSAWYNSNTYGGTVHDNSVSGAQLGFAVDKVSNFSIYNNNVNGSGGSFSTSCGNKGLSAFVITPGTIVDRSKDSIPSYHYLSYSLDGCIPNWWQNPY